MSRFCGKCGKPLSENERICPNCGAKQPISDQGGRKNGSEDPPAHGNRPGNHGGKKWAAIAALFVVAIAVGLGIFWWMHTQGDSLDEEDVLAAIENYQEVNDSIIALTSMEEYAALETPEKAEMVLAVLENLAKEEKVEADSIGYDADNVMIYFTYADGAYGGVMLEDFAEGVDGVGEASYDTLCDGSFLYNWPSVPDFGLDTSPYTQENLSALIVCDLGDEDATHLAQQEADAWNEAYLDTALVDSGTVSFFRKGLLGYDLVIIREHGSIYNGDPAIALQETTNWVDALAKEVGLAFADEGKAIVEDLKENRIALVLSDLHWHYVLLPEFFSYYYGDGKLADTIVWLGCCYGYYDANASLVSAFANCGAKAALAATDSINRLYGFLMQDAFTYMLLCGYNVEDSLEFAKSQWGYNDAVFAAMYLNKSDEDPAEIRYFNGGEETLVTLTSEASALMEKANALENEQGFYRIPAGSLSLYPWSDEETILLYGETVYRDVFQDSAASFARSVDGTEVTIHTFSDDMPLYYLSADKREVIDSNAALLSFVISSDGSAVLYMSLSGSLVVYDTSTSEKTEIYNGNPVFGVLSPSGNQVLFSAWEGEDEILYVYDGKTSTKLGKDYRPISISDDGVCYAENISTGGLYAFDKTGASTKISDLGYACFYLSYNHSEILFYSDSGTYISVNGGAAQRISSSQICPLSYIPLHFSDYLIYDCHSSLFDQIYATSDFYSSDYMYTNEYDSEYSDSTDFYYISPRHTAEQIASNVECFAASVDYSTVYYISGGKLYHASSADAYASEEIAAEGTAVHVYISDYGETAYYLTADGTLYCIESDGSSDKVSSGVETVAGFYNGYFYFTTSDNTLYYASQAAKTEVSSNVYSCFVSATGAYYVTADGDLYGSESGTQFSCLLSSPDGDYEEPDNAETEQEVAVTEEFVGNQTVEQLRVSIVGSWGAEGSVVSDYDFISDGTCYWSFDKHTNGTYEISNDKMLLISFPWTNDCQYFWTEETYEEWSSHSSKDCWYMTDSGVLQLNGTSYYRDGKVIKDYVPDEGLLATIVGSWVSDQLFLEYRFFEDGTFEENSVYVSQGVPLNRVYLDDGQIEIVDATHAKLWNLADGFGEISIYSELVYDPETDTICIDGNSSYPFYRAENSN